MEPILSASSSRYVTFPIVYKNLWEMYKKALASFWTAEEISFSDKDFNDWKEMTENERSYVKNILAFFAASDGIVMENIDLNFGSEVQISEARSFYAYQAFNESIHGETYSLLIDAFVKDPVEKNNLFNAMEQIKAIRSKADWAIRWFDSKKGFAERLVAFACVEGILFSSSFAGIFWLRKRNLLPALCVANNFIARDENLHCDFACELFYLLQNKPQQDQVHSIVSSAVEVETEFVKDSLSSDLIGLNSSLMIQYVQFVADRLCLQLGYEKIYNTKNPFEFMVSLGLSSKTNFFEHRESSYSKLGIGLETSDNKVSFHDEF
jgi:ribonucleoside-diphosphate reductase beta chain